MKKWLVLYAAGCLGALISALALWLAGRYGLTQALGVRWAPGLSAAWLYPQIVWGGVWGFLFLLPFMNSRWLAKSLILALIPALVHLLIIFPYVQGLGVAGLQLGLLTPLVVYLVWWIWALVTALTVRLS